MTWKQDFQQLAQTSGLLASLESDSRIASLYSAMGQIFSDLGDLATGEPVVRLSIQSPKVGTPASTIETDLATYTVVGGTLSANLQALRVAAWGSWTGGTDTRRIRLYFGATVILDVNLSQPATTGWRVVGYIVRDGASSEVTWTEGVVGQDPIVNAGVRTVKDGVAVVDTAADAIVKVTGQNGVATADLIKCNGFMVEHLR